MDTVKTYSEIKIAEWIMSYWIPVTAYGDSEETYVYGGHRPLDEAMKLAGGSIKDLRPYLWASKLYIPTTQETIIK